MPTFPKFPQPVFEQASTGLKFYLELTNNGVLKLRGPVISEVTPTRRITLVSKDRTIAYRLGVDSSAEPLITVSDHPAEFGAFEDLYVFSPNGREWTIQVNAAGILSIKALGSEWSRGGVPILKDSTGIPWRIGVADGGVMDVTSDPSENHHREVVLRSQDDSKAWRITVDTDGILSAEDDGVTLADAKYWDAEMVSPLGERWSLQVDKDGILSVDSISDIINQRDTWTLVMERTNGVLFVVDERFRSPWQGGRGRRGR